METSDWAAIGALLISAISLGKSFLTERKVRESRVKEEKTLLLQRILQTEEIFKEAKIKAKNVLKEELKLIRTAKSISSNLAETMEKHLGGGDKILDKMNDAEKHIKTLHEFALELGKKKEKVDEWDMENLKRESMRTESMAKQFLSTISSREVIIKDQIREIEILKSQAKRK